MYTYEFGAFHDMDPLLGWRKNSMSYGLKVTFFDLQLLQYLAVYTNCPSKKVIVLILITQPAIFIKQ
jgi:hypothetical protein